MLTTASIRRQLEFAGCVAADEEADELVAAAPDDTTLESWVRERMSGVPLAWITGSLRFCDQMIVIDRGVYVPRAQSEELARRAGAFLLSTGGRAVDLCTGCGAIAAYLSRLTGDPVVGVDTDALAVACARRNGVAAIRADLADGLAPRRFDVVTAVAPYVPGDQLRFLPADVQRYEPRLALDGGADGLDIVRRVLDAATSLLVPGGSLFLEVGGSQDVILVPNLACLGFGPVTTWFDDDGDLRGIAAEFLGPSAGC